MCGDMVRIKPYRTEHRVLAQGANDKCWWLQDVGNFYKHLCELVTDEAFDNGQETKKAASNKGYSQ